MGDKIEVWVASDRRDVDRTAFPAGDCRDAGPDTTTITDAQAQSLVDQFDNNMFPKESAAFSVAPDRDGSGNVVRPAVDYTGAGDKIVTLVDNVRDDNFYRLPGRPDLHRGLLLLAVQRAARPQRHDDRRVRLAAPHRCRTRPTRRPTDLCTSRPARARLYEGTFAHEYQHLLQHYQDPAEVNWVNEGLSDFAISLVGYGDAAKTVFREGRREPHLLLPGLRHGADAVQPEPARLRRTGELADPVG